MARRDLLQLGYGFRVKTIGATPGCSTAEAVAILPAWSIPKLRRVPSSRG